MNPQTKTYPPCHRADKPKPTGFGLVELLVALAIVGLLWGGAKYFKQYQTETGKAMSGAAEAKRQAEAAKALVEDRREF